MLEMFPSLYQNSKIGTLDLSISFLFDRCFSNVSSIACVKRAFMKKPERDFVSLVRGFKSSTGLVQSLINSREVGPSHQKSPTDFIYLPSHHLYVLRIRKDYVYSPNISEQKIGSDDALSCNTSCRVTRSVLQPKSFFCSHTIGLWK